MPVTVPVIASSVRSWSPENPGGRWRPYALEEILARDKASLDLTWLRDDALEDAATLADPDLIAAEIVEDLRAALEQFGLIGGDLALPAVAD